MSVINASTALGNTWGAWILEGEEGAYMDIEFKTRTHALGSFF